MGAQQVVDQRAPYARHPRQWLLDVLLAWSIFTLIASVVQLAALCFVVARG